VSALDVSVQAQVINLLEDLQVELGLTYLVIAHDLAVVRHIANRVGVMYLGGLVEEAGSDELYAEPLHPYTKALLSAVPVPDQEVEDGREQILLTGDLPSPTAPPSGCRFHTRCPWRQPIRCDDERPALREITPGHRVACHWAENIAAGPADPPRGDPGGGGFREQRGPRVHELDTSGMLPAINPAGVEFMDGTASATATRAAEPASRSGSSAGVADRGLDLGHRLEQHRARHRVVVLLGDVGLGAHRLRQLTPPRPRIRLAHGTSMLPKPPSG